MSDPMFEHRRVVEPMTELEYADLIVDMGIGCGVKEYKRGKKMLREDITLNDKQFRQAIKELAKWCEV